MPTMHSLRLEDQFGQRQRASTAAIRLSVEDGTREIVPGDELNAMDITTLNCLVTGDHPLYRALEGCPSSAYPLQSVEAGSVIHLPASQAGQYRS
jgi:hypothetical protein